MWYPDEKWEGKQTHHEGAPA